MNKSLFMTMKRRRISFPSTVQQLWDAVKVIRFQKQVPDIIRITRYMANVYNMSHEDVVRQLNYCVRDGLLILTKRVRNTGLNAGIEVEGYKIPEEETDKDSHDWYCFQCHSGGDVISCTNCYRVYHLSCVDNEDLPGNDDDRKFICNICKDCASIKEDSMKIKKSELNKLLHHTTNRLKEKIPLPWAERTIVPPTSSSDVTDKLKFQSHIKQNNLHFNMKCALKPEELWRIDLLIFKVIDFQMIENKTDNHEYKNVEEFRADILTFVHNIIIFHGDNSSMADNGRSMLRDCNQYLEEIIKCHYCYKYSMEKSSKYWFCKPCKPPHELVYAKQGEFPYWPAKVLKIEGNSYEVRFFGGEHQLGIIDKSQILSISVNIHTLQSKGRTSKWNKACEELRHHQEQLNKIMLGLATQSSSSSSSSENEEEQSIALDFPVQRHNRIEKATEEIKIEAIEADNDNLELNNDEDQHSKEIPVKRKRGRPRLSEQLKKSRVIGIRRPRGRPKKVVDPPVDTDNINVKRLKTKVYSSRKNISEPKGNKISKSASPLNTKSTQVDENKTMSSPCQDLVRSVQVQTEPVHVFSNSHLKKIQAEMEAEKRVAIELLIEKHNEEKSIMEENHALHIAEVKKKHWCVRCGEESIFYCCWNTAYCSVKCQLSDWDDDHKVTCRRLH